MTDMVGVAQQVCKDFGALPVLKGVTPTVGRGQVLVIVGPSGSGKSTFLRCINHLETVTAGRLYVDGSLVGYREVRGRLHELAPRDAAKQRRDVEWCSSTSTFSRIAPRWVTSSRLRFR